MGQLTWEQRKQIGEALGHESERDIDNCYYFGGATKGYSTLEGLWDAYQPDVLGEVIPWLEKNAPGWHSRHCEAGYFVDDDRSSALRPTFSEAVCALMLAVIEAQP